MSDTGGPDAGEHPARWWKDAVWTPVSMAVLVVACYLAQLITIPPMGLLALWPTSALGAALLLTRARWTQWLAVWVGIFGALLVDGWANAHGDGLTVDWYVIISWFEPLLVALVVRWLSPRDRGLTSLRGAAVLCGGGAVVLFVTTFLWALTAVDPTMPEQMQAHMMKAWVIRWLAEVVGLVTLTTFAAVVVQGRGVRRLPHRPIELGVCIVVTAVVCVITHGWTVTSPAMALGVFCLPMPLVLWAGARSDGAGAGLVGLVMLVCAVLALGHNSGPSMVMATTTTDRVLGMQLVVVVMTASALLVSGAASDGRWVRERLRQSELKYRTLFEESTDILVVFEPHTERVLAANRRAAQTWGLRLEQLVGSSLRDLTVDPRAGEEAQRLTMAHGRVDAYETVHRLEDGTLLHLLCTNTLIVYEGRPAILGQATDITTQVRKEAERQEMERRLAKALRLESIGVLAGGIAHDFNNTLVGILGGASAALRLVPEDSDAHRMLQTVERSAKRAAEMVRQLLASAGRADSPPQVLELSVVVREAMGLLPAAPAGVERTLELAGGLPRVRASESQVGRVVGNLVQNAEESLSGRVGRVAVRTYACDASEVGRRSMAGGTDHPKGRCVCLEVSDNGPGFADGLHERAFEPFASTKGPGRGLGLAAVLGIVRSIGGGIEVDSRPGEGAVFRVFLPAVKA